MSNDTRRARGCQWPDPRTHSRCGMPVKKRIHDSGLGYCLEHYPKVGHLREWFYSWAGSEEMKELIEAAATYWRRC
jgi:hypothetical protein